LSGNIRFAQRCREYLAKYEKSSIFMRNVVSLWRHVDMAKELADFSNRFQFAERIQDSRWEFFDSRSHARPAKCLTRRRHPFGTTMAGSLGFCAFA
jgi:hypothetical protein